MGRKSGATFKFLKPFHRWKSAMLRDAIEEAGYLVLKVDGIPEDSGPTEQIYIGLESYDAAKVCKDWLEILLLSNDKYDRAVANEALDQIMKARGEGKRLQEQESLQSPTSAGTERGNDIVTSTDT